MASARATADTFTANPARATAPAPSAIGSVNAAAISASRARLTSQPAASPPTSPKNTADAVAIRFSVCRTSA
jgi:hypothetical protein